MLELGAQPIANTPEAFARQIPQEVKKWQDVVKATGVSVE
jgi:tripartite-type tricarboxylate transporter receptor subunit TctC